MNKQILFGLVCGCVLTFFLAAARGDAQKAPRAPGWEYKVFSLERAFIRVPDAASSSGYSDELSSWSCHLDGHKLDECDSLNAVINRFGAQGWELATTVGRASSFGAAWAGVTTEELWTFKRPKQ
jgi:hypothetical protein